MKYHSEYYKFGFSRSEIEKFLQKYDIVLSKVQVEPTPQTTAYPVWATELKTKEMFTVWQAASVLIKMNPFGVEYESSQYNERYNVAKDLLDEAAELGKIKSELRNGVYSFHQNDLRVWASSIQREWCIPPLLDFDSTENDISESKSNDVIMQRLQKSEREKVGLQTENTKLKENIEAAHKQIKELQKQLEVIADKLIAETKSKASFQSEFDALKTDALEGKTKSTILRLLGGMAMIGAEIDIHAARLVGIKQTVSDLALKGVEVDDDTLSKRLKEAAELIAKPRK